MLGTTFEQPYKLIPLINSKKQFIVVGVYDRIKTDEMGAVRTRTRNKTLANNYKRDIRDKLRTKRFHLWFPFKIKHLHEYKQFNSFNLPNISLIFIGWKF